MNRNRLYLASLAISVLLLAACSKTPVAEDAALPTAVRVATAISGPAAPAMLGTGIIASKNELALSFKIGGVIKRIAVSEGAVVKKGQLLAELEPAEIDAQVTQAQQLADKAQRERERGERLYKDQVIALEQLEALRTQADIAKAQLKSVNFNLRYAAITATADGIVLRKLADEHQIIAAGQPVIGLGERDGGYVVKAGLADREVVQLKLGDTAVIRLDALPAQTFNGRVSEISRAANVQNGLFPVEVRLENAPSNLSSGMVAQLRITPASANGAQLVYVPIAAIVEGDAQRAWVFTLNDNKAHKQAVEVAFINGDQVALRSGLAAGTQVITDGVLYLSDGESISVAP